MKLITLFLVSLSMISFAGRVADHAAKAKPEGEIVRGRPTAPPKNMQLAATCHQENDISNDGYSVAVYTVSEPNGKTPFLAYWEIEVSHTTGDSVQKEFRVRAQPQKSEGEDSPQKLAGSRLLKNGQSTEVALSINWFEMPDAKGERSGYLSSGEIQASLKCKPHLIEETKAK